MPDREAVKATIVRVAGEFGDDPALGLATGEEESGFDPLAVGDNGCSFSVFQDNRCGGAGTGVAISVLQDPEISARRFYGRVQGVRASGFTGSPGEIAAAAQRPAHPDAYAQAVNELYRQYVVDAPQAPVHPADAERGTASTSSAFPVAAATAIDVAGDIAALPTRVAGSVAKRAIGSAFDRGMPPVVILILVLLAVFIIVEVVS